MDPEKIDWECYFKVLWVVLEERRGITYLNAREQQDYKTKLENAVHKGQTSDTIFGGGI